MSKKTKVWLVIAAILVILGALTLLGVIRVCDGDFSKLDTIKHVENTIEITEDFNDIELEVVTVDIEFVVSNDGSCKVYSFEEEDTCITAIVKDGVLKITEPIRGSIIPNIGFNLQDKLTVYLPKSEYGLLDIKTKTSDIIIPADFKFNDVNIKNTTGDVYCDCSVVNNTNVKATTGDVIVKNNFSNKLNISLTTGDVKLDNIDPKEIFVKTTTGDIDGMLLSDKVFKTQVTTGDISVPNTNTGGVCDLKTTTGDINIKIKK